MPSTSHRRARGSSFMAVTLAVAAGLSMWQALGASLSFVFGPRNSCQLRQPAVSTRAVEDEVVKQVTNTVKTVADTNAEFWSLYAGEPLLPMFRPYVMDLITQSHLSLVDARFKYDAVWALGMRDYFELMMGSYDRMVREGESEKVWSAMTKALGLDGETVKADAEAARAYAKATKPAEILGALERTTPAPDAKVAAAFDGISKGLFTNTYAVGLFRIMEYMGVELKKANVEEWVKALGLKSARATAALDTYLAFQKKLEQAMELLREMEIREKKNLAERLEQKAKALAAKASEKKAEAGDEEKAPVAAAA